MKKNSYIIGTAIIIALLVNFYLNKKPLISVILPTYNRAEFLPRAIDSILKQTKKNFELIIINDGSSDKTADILKDYAEKDKRIIILTHEQNKGSTYSLNEGIKVAKGKYIARMDDVDEAFPQRFERQIEFLERRLDIVGIGSWESPIGNLIPYAFQKNSHPERLKIFLLLGKDILSGSSLMIRRKFLRDFHIEYKETYKTERDREFYADIMFSGGKLSNVQEILMHKFFDTKNIEENEGNRQRNIEDFQKDYLKKYFDIQGDKILDSCQLLQLLMEKNKKRMLLNQKELEKITIEKCKNKNLQRLTFIHDSWKDSVIIEGTELYRVSNKDKAKILNKTNSEITIKWDRWDTETFTRIFEEIYQLKK